jgi:molybdopterin-guanine dinucleotide biosynthesis protein A
MTPPAVAIAQQFQRKANTMNTEEITGLILAGGRGTRMGHVDKGLQNFRGAPMALHVMLRLQPQVGELMINANQNLAPYESFGVPVWPDEMQGYAGPLAGMQTGLIHCTTEYMVTAPCDSPFLPTDLVARLADRLVDAGADLAVAVTGAGAARQVHPVFCLMKTSLLQHLSEYLRDGGRKIDAWYASLNTVEVDFADEAAFRNINTIAELKQYEPTPGQQ